MIRVLEGHCIDVLAGMAEQSVHLSVCSPPYLWLRSYDTPPQVWAPPDGIEPCAGEHEWEVEQTRKQGDGTYKPVAWVCARCTSWRGELGSEPTVESYVAHLVQVFSAVKRVLRDDGLCWVNLAGSYFNNPGGQNGGAGNTLDYRANRISPKVMAANAQAGRQDRTGRVPAGYWLKPLDYVDVPGLFARAMQADGWLWRADICLVKRAPLPESVSGWRWERCRIKVAPSRRSEDRYKAAAYGTPHSKSTYVPGTSGGQFVNQAAWVDCPGCAKCRDNEGLILRRGNGRPTRAWERFLVFAKREGAFWDSDAVREPHAGYEYTGKSGINRQEYMPPEKDGQARASFKMQSREYHPAGRNMRDWLLWPHGVTKEQHYAAYPEGLPELAIKASTSEHGVCPACGAPWARVINPANRYNDPDHGYVSLQQVRGGAASGSFRDGQTEDGRQAPDMQGVRPDTASGSEERKPRTRASFGGAVPPGERGESTRGEAPLSTVGAGASTGRCSVEAVCLQPEGPDSATRERTAQPKDTQGQGVVKDTLLSASGTATSGGGNVHRSGLADDPGAPATQMFLLPSTVHEAAAGNDRPCNPLEQGRAPLAREHRGSVPGVQRSEVEPDGTAGVTLGWRPTCPCPDAGPPIGATVLDPFSGSGTSLLVAHRMGRNAVGVDLNPEYVAMQEKRVSRTPLSLFDAVAAGAVGEEAAGE